MVLSRSDQHETTHTKKPPSVLAAKWKAFKKNGYLHKPSKSKSPLTDAEVFYFSK